jgi:glycosyltransferase 2 family protein
MSGAWKKRLSSLARLLVCAAAIAWLVRDPKWKWGELLNVIRSADWRLVMLALLTFGPCPVLISFRLKWLLAVHQVFLSNWQAIKVTFAGNFITWILPAGTSGGDAVKAVYIAKDTPHKHEAVTTVFFDRLIGVVSLILMSGIMVLLNRDNPAFAKWGRIIGLLTVLFFGGAGLYISTTLRRLLRVDWMLARLPLGGHLQRIDQALLAFRNHRARVALSLLVTVALQGFAIFSLYLAGWGLGMVQGRPMHALAVYLAYTPICFLAAALPIGVMEITFVELFSTAAGFGSPGAALTLSVIGRLIQLVWSLPGALVVIRGGTYRQVKEMAEQDAEPSPQPQ